jgi:hypothetical protein
MLAGTIAEYRIDEGRVLLELEISGADIEAFPNLLPDTLYAQLGHTPRPYADRVRSFFEHDLAISVDGGPPLPGRILEIAPRPRAVRDDITGEPLPIPDSEDEPELAVFARLEYALPGRPGTLTLFGPRTQPPVSVGFVAYHQGVAVNDFRYLTQQQTLELDWDDPWYSRFEIRTLRRQYFAPMAGFIYVEPYEVRKEIIARPVDLQRFVDLGLDGLEVIPATLRADVTRKIGEFLRDHHPVRIDGREVPAELARVNFLERTLRTSRVVEPGADLDIHSALVGAIFVYPTDGLPRQVTMEWDLWDERITNVPVASVDQAGALPDTLRPEGPVLTWTNFLTNPRIPSLEIVASPPGALARAMGFVRWAALLLLLGLIGVSVRSRQRPSFARQVGVALAGVATLGAFGWTWQQRLSQDDAAEIVSGLLINVYRAFDYRDESRIYDTLAASAHGAVLEQAYLETRRGLELQSQGGARAKVDTVELMGLDVRSDGDHGFRARATWNVAGSIGHWGHVHQRRNQYEAELEIAPVEGAWKLVGLDVLREDRQ